MYILYLALFVVFLIIEALTVNLVTIWMAIGALVASIVSFFVKDNTYLPAAVFVIVSLIMILLTKPLTKKMKSQKVSTNSDRLIGETGIVFEDINNIEAVGSVKVNGQIWTARSENNTIIEKNKKIIIKRIEGVKLIVSQKEEE